jgi:hypothetical protein
MNRRLFAWLRLFLPVALLIGLGAYAYVDSHRASRLSEISASEASNVSMGAAMLDRRTQIIRHDLNFLARLNAIEGAAGPDIARMAKSFIELLRVKPVYDQMRWIDASGQELLRVELKDGAAFVVAKDQLQDKAGRYYVTETLKLAAGEVYISPLDLNVENGAIEVPRQADASASHPTGRWTWGKTRHHCAQLSG